MIRLLLLLAPLLAFAEDMPSWVLPGLLAVETGSSYRDDGTIRYVDKRRGSAGERGCFQMTKAAFMDVHHAGELFWKVEVDTGFAEEVAVRYLYWLRERSESWEAAVEAYNAGLRHRAPLYLNAVRAAGGAQ